ncbi:MAG: fructose-6-phosphate aldolase [Proteobacteria bacterium]|nr:fructose-6-phosphate aldolase [Pseudomonadota bacterium]
MKIFIDTANIQEIRQANSWGFLDGVTTNPSLIAATKRTFREVIEEICAEITGPVNVEVIAKDSPGMVREGRELAKLANNIVLKIPMTPPGIQATRQLSGEGIKVNITLVFSPLQALLAAKAGASYASPFIGRLDDISHTGMELINDIVTIYDNYSFPTEIIVASIRHPLHVLDAARIGAGICTIPLKVIEQMFKHPLTDIGLEKFLKDWEKIPKSS